MSWLKTEAHLGWINGRRVDLEKNGLAALIKNKKREKKKKSRFFNSVVLIYNMGKIVYKLCVSLQDVEWHVNYWIALHLGFVLSFLLNYLGKTVNKSL